MECVMCGKTKQEWYLCRDCYELMKKKYPDYNDFIMTIKMHKNQRRFKK